MSRNRRTTTIEPAEPVAVLPLPPAKVTCGSCLAFNSVTKRCQAGPPQTVSPAPYRVASEWPEVNPDVDWCLQHKRRGT